MHATDANKQPATATIDPAPKAKRALFAASSGPAKAESAEDLMGAWRVVSVEVFNAYLACDIESFSDWSIVFDQSGRASVCLYGNELASRYSVSDGVVSFEDSQLASLHLEAEDGMLYLSGLGMKFTFVPHYTLQTN